MPHIFHHSNSLMHSFWAHLNWKLKWAFLIKCGPVSVCPSVNFPQFHLLLQKHSANFNQTYHKASLGDGIQVSSNEGKRSFSRGDTYNYEIAKINWRYLKILFFRITESISTKLGTKHHWVLGIQVCSNERPCPIPRGDNYEIAKTHWRNSNIFFSRTTWPDSYQTWHKASLGDGNSVLFKWRATPFTKGRWLQNAKIHWR